jgi:hypothetical protein
VTVFSDIIRINHYPEQPNILISSTGMFMVAHVLTQAKYLVGQADFAS